jgi:hypothetical protein
MSALSVRYQLDQSIRAPTSAGDGSCTTPGDRGRRVGSEWSVPKDPTAPEYCGKSVILNLITGFIEPMHGQVGERVKRMMVIGSSPGPGGAR